MADKLSAEAAAQPYKQARETQDEVDALRAQRDELLTAGIELLAVLDIDYNNLQPSRWRAYEKRYDAAEAGLRAAIARCKEK